MVTGAPVPVIAQTQKKWVKHLVYFLGYLSLIHVSFTNILSETVAHGFTKAKEFDSGRAVKSFSVFFFFLVCLFFLCLFVFLNFPVYKF